MFLRAISEERIDVMITVPAVYWLAISQPAFAAVDVSGVRSVAYGGAPIAPDLVAAGAPRVCEAAVLGVPDEMMGEKVGAVIVVRGAVDPAVSPLAAGRRAVPYRRGGHGGRG